MANENSLQQLSPRNRDETTFIQGFRAGGQRETEIEIKELDIGDYYIGVEVDWNKTLLGEDKKYSICCYGPQKVDFKQTGTNLGDLLKDTYESILAQQRFSESK